MFDSKNELKRDGDRFRAYDASESNRFPTRKFVLISGKTIAILHLRKSVMFYLQLAHASIFIAYMCTK
jgi:hypothetical protein